MSEFKNILTDRRTEDSLTANMALFYFLIPGQARLGQVWLEFEIFLIYPCRDLALSSSPISASFYPSWAGRRHLKEFLITVLLVRSSGEQYRDNATDETRDIFHFDETKEEYFGTNIHYSFSPEPTSLVFWWMHSIVPSLPSILVQNGSIHDVL